MLDALLRPPPPLPSSGRGDGMGRSLTWFSPDATVKAWKMANPCRYG